ncbi:MAG: helix-turn-helix transcriptional regulator [Alistipes sp.]|nr:helix-turn-helix transcriptional regulator [Alistipes sp.]
MREEKGETQHNVYLETDLNIGNLETGRTNFTISTISILCDYYGISLKDFFDSLEY